MPPLDMTWQLARRPVKPVAFGMLLSMLILAGFAVTNRGVLDGSSWADLLAVCAGTTAAMLSYGWLIRSQQWARWGLLAAFGVWVARTVVILCVAPAPFRAEGLYLSAVWALIAAGSYFLETADHLGRD